MYVILFGTSGGFPTGYAATSRTILYARGLIDAGGHVRVFCTQPSEYQNVVILNRDVKGNIEGVEFEYTCGTTIRGKTLIQQKWLVLKGLFVAAWRIWLLNKNSGVEVLFLFSGRWVAILLYWLVAKLCGAKYVGERNEKPFYQDEHNFFWKTVSFFYTHTLIRLFDGVIVISDYLWQYMRKRMHRKAVLLKVPIIVDVQKFSLAKSPPPISGRYLAYAGPLNEVKDGVQTIIKAFAMVCDEFPDLKLVLIGDSIKVSMIPTYRLFAENLAISDRVVFTGWVARNDLQLYLGNATILLLAKPFSRQSEAVFPTKLGEYLATGKPVLVTKTGEIATYLDDKFNIFLTPPNDVAAFAECIRYILLHPEEAEAVGRRGQDAALRYFDYRENGRKIKIFFDHLCQGNP